MPTSSQLTLQVNTAGAWKNVCKVDRARARDVRDAVVRLAGILPDAKWCLRDPQGGRDWIKPAGASRVQSMRTMNGALSIADDWCRADIECYAHGELRAVDGAAGAEVTVYDLTRPSSTHPSETEETLALQVKIAQRAAEYIRGRGDVFAWRMREIEGEPHLVWFEVP